VAVSKDTPRIVSGSGLGAGTVTVWDADTGRVLHTLRMPSHASSRRFGAWTFRRMATGSRRILRWERQSVGPSPG
jgi:hypothetical protein